jgi:Zn finger protein HypA/HybF involved in hydrogenase expression
LSSKEITQVRSQVKKLRALRNQLDFSFNTIEGLYKDKIKIIIDEKKDYLKCTRCTNGACDGARDTEYLFVCKDLPKELYTTEQVRRSHMKKVGDFTYKQQPNKSGNLYWYIQFTVRGKTKTIYLGSEKPLFRPEEDIANVKTKKEQKKIKQKKMAALAD